MKLNFYSKLAVLLCAMVPHCFAATASALQPNASPIEDAKVAAGLAIIKKEDDARCAQYQSTPGEFDRYKSHTAKIDALLSDTKKVSNVAATEDAIRTIVTAAIDKEITHRNDSSKTSAVKATLKDLTTSDALYNHFHVLSLIEDVAVSFVTGGTNVFNSIDFDTIASSADSIYGQITAINSKITKKLFTECLSITYGKHKDGIRNAIAKDELAETERVRLAAAAKTIKDKEIEDARLAAEAKAIKDKEIEDARLAADAKAIQNKEIEDARLAAEAKAIQDKEIEDARLAAEAKAIQDKEIEDARLAAEAKAIQDKEIEDARLAADAKATQNTTEPKGTQNKKNKKNKKK